MSGKKLENLNVASQETLITPEALKQEMPLSEKAAETVANGRQAIYDIMDGKDHRLFIVVGPCSIHDVEAARDYAARLKKLADEVSEQRTQAPSSGGVLNLQAVRKKYSQEKHGCIATFNPINLDGALVVN